MASNHFNVAMEDDDGDNLFALTTMASNINGKDDPPIRLKDSFYTTAI